MKLAIADPPYPPLHGAGGRKPRATRWYGDGQRSAKDRPSDFNSEAGEWDDPKRHRQLLEHLMDEYDGWVIATSEDGLGVYHPLPQECRIMVWVKTNAQPGAHRIGSYWEPVIVFPPKGRRSNRGPGMMKNVLETPVPGKFIGRKPAEWTEWVLSALTYDPEVDEVVDLFPGSGAVTDAVVMLGGV